jgi:hypothetical protein
MFEKEFIVTAYFLTLSTLNFFALAYLLVIIESLRKREAYWTKKLQSFLGINKNKGFKNGYI